MPVRRPTASLPGGETALMTAARTVRCGAVAALLKHGADVNAKERNGQTASCGQRPRAMRMWCRC